MSTTLIDLFTTPRFLLVAILAPPVLSQPLLDYRVYDRQSVSSLELLDVIEYISLRALATSDSPYA